MLNKAMVIGNLGADPELRYTPNGRPVASLRVATNENYTDSQGNPKTNTQWHRITVWGKQAESCGKYLTKGRQVYVEGRLETRPWTDKDGVKRFTTEIVANRVQFLGSNPNKQDNSQSVEGQEKPDQFAEPPVDLGDEVGQQLTMGDIDC